MPGALPLHAANPHRPATLTPVSTRRPGLRSVLRRPGYRRLWAARTVSQWGDVVQFTVMALLVFRLTGSALGVSTAVLLEALPVVLLAPLAGPVVDRLPRIAVMVAADLMRAGLAAALAIWHGDVHVAYAVAFGLSAGAVFFNPAVNAVLPTVVAAEELVAANSAIWSAAVVSQLVLAPLAGVLAASVGFTAAFALNAVSFAISALLLARGRWPAAAAPAPAVVLWRAGVEAFTFLARDRLLRALVIGQALAALSAGGTSALLVVLAQQRLHTGGGGYGLMLAAIATGAFLGPTLLGRLIDSIGRSRVVFAAFGLRGAVDAVLATVTALPAALGALVGYGIGTSTGNVAFASLVQAEVAADMRGRVFAAFDLTWHLGRLVSIVVGGVVADAYGVRAVFSVGAALLAVAGIVGFVLVRPVTAAPSG